MKGGGPGEKESRMRARVREGATNRWGTQAKFTQAGDTEDGICRRTYSSIRQNLATRHRDRAEGDVHSAALRKYEEGQMMLMCTILQFKRIVQGIKEQVGEGAMNRWGTQAK